MKLIGSVTFYVISTHIMPTHIISAHIISTHIMPTHIISAHIISTHTVYNLISKKSSNLKPENLPMVLNFNGVIDICVHCAYIFPYYGRIYSD